MKNLKFIFLRLVVFFAFPLFFSCNKESNEIAVEELDPNNDIQASILEIINQTGDKGIPFPEGSKAFENKDGSVTIKLPEGYQFILSEESTSRMLPPEDEVGVTCTCNQGSGGCSPVKAKGSYYCVMNDNCSNCSKSVSKANKTVNILGVYKPEEGISFISNNEVEGLKSSLYTSKEDVYGNFFPELLSIEEVKKSLLELYTIVYSDKIPEFILTNSNRIPKGYSYVKVNIYGNEAVIPVPNDYVDESMRALPPEDEVGGVSCTCNKGKGCKLSSMLGVKYCDAGSCTSCTLND